MTPRITVIVGDSPDQVVVRAMAACLCPTPEHHHLYAQALREQVVANEGAPEWPFVLVMEGTDGWDLTAEGVRTYALDMAVAS